MVVAYLLFWPVPAEPVSWLAPTLPGFTGVFAPNTLLSGCASSTSVTSLTQILISNFTKAGVGGVGYDPNSEFSLLDSSSFFANAGGLTESVVLLGLGGVVVTARSINRLRERHAATH